MIELNEVYFSYDEAPVLKNINLTIERGEKVGIIGESGSGKTTLQKLLTKELKPNQGTLKVDGTLLPIFQSPIESFNPRVKIISSLGEALKYYLKLPKEKRHEYIKSELPKYDLNEDLLYNFPEEVSGGELQRFNIMRTMMQQSECVICDEITSNLDVFSEKEIIHLLKEEHERRHNTLLIISHNIAMLSHVVDRIVVLYQHEIVDDFSVEEIFNERRHKYTKELVDLFR